jgi:hypothetical protein
MREIDQVCQEIFDRELESLQDPISGMLVTCQPSLLIVESFVPLHQTARSHHLCIYVWMANQPNFWCRSASPRRYHFEHQENDKGGGFAPRSTIHSSGQSRGQTSASSTREVADHHLHLRFHNQSRAPRQRPKKKHAYGQ